MVTGTDRSSILRPVLIVAGLVIILAGIKAAASIMSLFFLAVFLAITFTPEQVIGSSIKTEFQLRNGTPALVRLPEINFVDEYAAKPVAINQHIGRRPLAAFGNSDGDQQMLQWTAAGSGPRLACLVHHTDAGREWAYDRQSSVGHLDKALDEAQAKGWTVVDMKKDWGRVFPFDDQ